MHILYWIKRFLGFLPICALRVWASKQTVHRQALEETGIRIVTTVPDGERFQEETWRSLQMLRLHAPRSLDRIKKHVSVIFIHNRGHYGHYFRFGRMCVLNISLIPDDLPPQTRLTEIALVLIHEATHGVMHSRKIPSSGSLIPRIEMICEKEELKLLIKLEKAPETEARQDKAVR